MKRMNHVIVLDMYGVILEESKGNFVPYTVEFFRELASRLHILYN